MNEIIDVEFKEVQKLEEKDIKTLAMEVNQIYGQMEIVGNVGVMLAIQGGKRLKVIKKKLGHGEWENWIKDNLNFSSRKANNMMKLATKLNDENSIFSNPKIFTDIGISKVYALLSTTEEIAEEVLEKPETSEMSVRDLKEEIKKIEAEKKQTDKEKAELEKQNKELLSQNYQFGEKKQELAQTIMEQDDKLAKYVKETLELKSEINRLKENPVTDDSKIEEMEKVLEEATDKLRKANEQLALEKDKLKKAEDIKETAIEEAIREAKAAAEAEHEAEIKRLKDKQAAAEAEHEAEVKRLKDKAEKNSDTDLIEFKIKSDILQTDFNDCLKAITAVEVADPEQSNKMKTALKKVMEALTTRI